MIDFGNFILMFIGIHGFLGIFFILSSLSCLLLFSNKNIRLTIMPILILGTIHLYYSLYYSGSMIYFPFLLGIYPWLGILGHFFLYHSLLEIHEIRRFRNRLTIYHLFPVIIEGMRILLFFKLPNEEKIAYYLENYRQTSPEAFPDKFSIYIFAVISIFYITKTFLILHNLIYKAKSKQIRWKLFLVQTFLLAIYSFWIFSSDPIIHISLPILFSILIPIFLGLSIFLPFLYQIGSSIHTSDNFSLPKYAKSGLRNVNLEKLESDLDFLIGAKFYLEEEMSLPLLAKKCNVTTHQLSEYFNVIKGTNYSEFIKKLRIQESIKLIQSNKEWNMTRVGFEAGFQSVSAFYDAFKKEMGISPKEFKKFEN